MPSTSSEAASIVDVIELAVGLDKQQTAALPAQIHMGIGAAGKHLVRMVGSQSGHTAVEQLPVLAVVGVIEGLKSLKQVGGQGRENVNLHGLISGTEVGQQPSTFPPGPKSPLPFPPRPVQRVTER